MNVIDDLTQEQFSRLSELLDESIEMPPEVRTTWLGELDQRDPKLAAMMRALFAAQNECAAQGFLEARGELEPIVSSLTDRDSALIGRLLGPYRPGEWEQSGSLNAPTAYFRGRWPSNSCTARSWAA